MLINSFFNTITLNVFLEDVKAIDELKIIVEIDKTYF